MALNVSETQIYAGRYHYKSKQIPDLLNAQHKSGAENQLFRDEKSVDTVSISEEGWEQLRNHPNVNNASYDEQIAELNRELHTVNNIDPVSMFQCELGKVASQIQSEYQLSERSGSHEEFLTVMAKAYQTVYDRIEEDFADPDRETTYVKLEDGTYREETKEDRIAALNQAYHSRADFAASSARSVAEIQKYFGGKDYGEDFLDELQSKVKKSWSNAISEKNLERLRRKVASFQDYSINTGISSEWSNIINDLLYRRSRR